MKSRIFAFFLLLTALCTAIPAQTLQQGRNMFAAGDYEGALPVMQKYLKQSPNDASRNYWYGVCLYETGSKEESLKYLEKAAEKKIVKAYKYIGRYHTDFCDYPAAIESYQKFVDGLKADKSLHDETVESEYESRIDSLKLVYRMFRSTGKVCFIDSFAISKDNLLQTYMLDPSTGSIGSYREFFGEDMEGDVFKPEAGAGIYFCRQENDSSRFGMYRAYNSLGQWTDVTPIAIGSKEADVRYPFVMSDGVTTYFASNGPESLGGYDIFVTRFNPSTGSYLVPENIGMPFNSDANDYLYVIDEINNLGWFATDRNQTGDSVCVYVFIPDDTRPTYDIGTDSIPLISRAARIASIAETQTDESLVRTSRQKLTLLLYSNLNAKKDDIPAFIIDDLTDYHSATDFHSPKAGDLFKEWTDKKNQLDAKSRELSKLRDAWSEASMRERDNMRAGLLSLEQEVEALERTVTNLEVQTRNTEIQYLTR